VHPRLAHMLLRARSLGEVELAADLAALLSERDLLRGAAGARDADVRTRLDVFRSDRAPQGIDRGALERARRMARDLARRLAAGAPSRGGARRNARGARGAERTAGAAQLSAPGSFSRPDRAPPPGPADVGVLLAFAYPDRIGRRRAGGEGRYTLANGRGAH